MGEEIGHGGKTGAEQLAEYCIRQALKGSARHAELFLAYIAELIEEKMFRREQGVKFELVRKIISGVERTILVAKLRNGLDSPNAYPRSTASPLPVVPNASASRALLLEPLPPCNHNGPPVSWQSPPHAQAGT